MFVRLPLAEEEDEVVGMFVADLQETRPGEPYDEGLLRLGYRRYLSEADPTIFVVEHKRALIGVAAARMVDFDYRAGFYVTQRVVYVSPENRGTRASVLLLKYLIRWSRSIGAVRIDGGNDNSFQSDRTARFLKHFGFREVGFALTLDLDGGDGEKRRGE